MCEEILGLDKDMSQKRRKVYFDALNSFVVLIKHVIHYIVSSTFRGYVMIEGTEFLVKQCPCFREFEGEQLCVNDNYIRKMTTIDVDTELIGSKHVSDEFINSKTEQDDLCFCLAYLGEDELYHCVSQQQDIKVQGQQVRKEEMQRALEILAPENARFSSVLCGECLYNIIAALKDEGEAVCPI